MQLFCALLGLLAQWVSSETIIGYDGKEHHWHPHRDGLHDHALHERERHRRHDISHPRLRRFEAHQLPHMLNQAPIIVSQHNLRIAVASHHKKSFGFGVGSTPKTLAASEANATKESATMGLSRMEKNMMDNVYGNTAEEGKHAAKRDQSFHFRAGHKQSEQAAAEDLTAQEVERELRQRHHMAKSKARRAGAAPAAATPAAASAGGAPAPGPAGAPMASPAASPEPAEEEKEYNDHSTMDEDIGASEQGFSGEIVEHDNMKTMTKDWRGEYGPGYEGQHSFVKICAMYPDNQWCHDRGYHHPTAAPKSAALRSESSALALTSAIFCYVLFS